MFYKVYIQETNSSSLESLDSIPLEKVASDSDVIDYADYLINLGVYHVIVVFRDTKLSSDIPIYFRYNMGEILTLNNKKLKNVKFDSFRNKK